MCATELRMCSHLMPHILQQSALVTSSRSALSHANKAQHVAPLCHVSLLSTKCLRHIALLSSRATTCEQRHATKRSDVPLVSHNEQRRALEEQRRAPCLRGDAYVWCLRVMPTCDAYLWCLCVNAFVCDAYVWMLVSAHISALYKQR